MSSCFFSRCSHLHSRHHQLCHAVEHRRHCRVIRAQSLIDDGEGTFIKRFGFLIIALGFDTRGRKACSQGNTEHVTTKSFKRQAPTGTMKTFLGYHNASHPTPHQNKRPGMLSMMNPSAEHGQDFLEIVLTLTCLSNTPAQLWSDWATSG